MLVAVQLLSIGLVFLLTYLAFLALGPRKGILLVTREEREQWARDLPGARTGWMVVANIVGTITSLATVYVFFLGSSSVFGIWTALCSVTIFIGAFVTNGITARLLKNPLIANRINTRSQTGGVISALFWSNDRRDVVISRVVKWLSMLNILAILWLEFSVFADASGMILGLDSLAFRAASVFVIALLIIHFTLRYGLRGFVFADLFQAPLIGLAALSLLSICGVMVFKAQHAELGVLQAMIRPVLPLNQCVAFAAHVFLLNGLLVLVTEGHWIRLWMFSDQETRVQVRAVGLTAALWLVLILAGWSVSFLVGGKTGLEAVGQWLHQTAAISPMFVAIFWVGGIAALFSTADAQIYAFLLVEGFDTKRGELSPRPFVAHRPLTWSIIAAGLLAFVYLAIRTTSVPIDKLIFIIIPFSLNILPPLAALAFRRRPRVRIFAASLLIYAVCVIIGVRNPPKELLWTFIASFVPVVGAIAMVAWSPRADVEFR